MLIGRIMFPSCEISSNRTSLKAYVQIGFYRVLPEWLMEETHAGT